MKHKKINMRFKMRAHELWKHFIMQYLEEKKIDLHSIII